MSEDRSAAAAAGAAEEYRSTLKIDKLQELTGTRKEKQQLKGEISRHHHHPGSRWKRSR